MNNSYGTRRSRQYPGGHTMNRRLDRISASAASTLLVASREHLTDIFTSQRRRNRPIHSATPGKGAPSLSVGTYVELGAREHIICQV
jgi:hypothetical protein